LLFGITDRTLIDGAEFASTLSTLASLANRSRRYQTKKLVESGRSRVVAATLTQLIGASGALRRAVERLAAVVKSTVERFATATHHEPHPLPAATADDASKRPLLSSTTSSSSSSSSSRRLSPHHHELAIAAQKAVDHLSALLHYARLMRCETRLVFDSTMGFNASYYDAMVYVF
jgi:hypothetical protein